MRDEGGSDRSSHASRIRTLLTPRGPAPSPLAFAVGALLTLCAVSVAAPTSFDLHRANDVPAVDSPWVLVWLALAASYGALMAIVVRLRRPSSALLTLLFGSLVISLGLAACDGHMAAYELVGGACIRERGLGDLIGPRRSLQLAAALIPVALASPALRKVRAPDQRARFAGTVGAWMTAVGVVLAVISLDARRTFAMALPGVALMAFGLLDTRRRIRALSDLADTGMAWVGPPPADAPEHLAPLVTLPHTLAHDGVLRVYETPRDAAYRAPRLSLPLALYPMDVPAAARALGAQLRTQRRWLVLAVLFFVGFGLTLAVTWPRPRYALLTISLC